MGALQGKAALLPTAHSLGSCFVSGKLRPDPQRKGQLQSAQGCGLLGGESVAGSLSVVLPAGLGFPAPGHHHGGDPGAQPLPAASLLRGDALLDAARHRKGSLPRQTEKPSSQESSNKGPAVPSAPRSCLPRGSWLPGVFLTRWTHGSPHRASRGSLGPHPFPHLLGTNLSILVLNQK